MPHYGTLHDFAFSEDIDDIRGTVLYGAGDEKLGKIDDIIFDHTSGDIKYAVVDTGGWFTHKKFLVPADRIHAYGGDKDAFQIDTNKDRIERSFPRYDENQLKSDKDWDKYETEYKRAWDVDPVQHRDDRVDLDVTPATVAGAGSGPGVPMGSMGEVLPEPNPDLDRDREALNVSTTPQRLAGKFPEATQSGDKTHLSPAHYPERSYDQARVGSERVPDRAWEDNPTGASGNTREPGVNLNDEYPVDVNPPANPTQQTKAAHKDVVPGVAGADVGQWHPRMKRFEDVLRKNRVDVTASCASCKPQKEKAA